MMSNNFNNLDIPYYQNDKWVNMLKRKIKNLKENIEKEEEINKRLTIKNEFKNDLFANIDNHHQTQTSFPLLKPYTTQSSFHSESVYGKTTEDFRRKAFSTILYGMQMCNLNKMFPNIKRKERKAFSKSRPPINKVVFSSLTSMGDTDKGIQTIQKRENEIKKCKEKYINYIKQKSQNDYFKYYFN